ncbi:MAG TPA: alanine--glyoxylate aminotransferase family protein [Clostridia bacterium]|nr:alanine--glyoxylate aminotransferase family protein [Clostridia bacterium]
MFRKTRLFTPGPTPLLPAAQFAMAAADFHHRTPEFRALYSRVLAQLREFVGTQNDVLVLASSGTGAMEAAVSNLTSPGDRVLVLQAGKFGERWTALARAFGCEVAILNAPYGETFSAEQIGRHLTPQTRAVFMQATESSTGVRHCVQAVAAMLRGTDTLLVVDAITGLGTTEFDIDGDGVDVIIGGSQKALMIPPGLAYLAVSKRAWQRMETSRQPRYYFDLRKERKNAANGESSYTPAVSLIAAMGAALDYLAAQGEGSVAEGRRRLVANAELCAAMTRAAAAALGLGLFAPVAPSAALTAVKAPAGISSSDIVKKCKSKFGAVMTDGQGEMKGQIFRIAHIGFFDPMDTLAIVGALEQTLFELTPGKVTLGVGLAAAQQVWRSALEGQASGQCACGREQSACISTSAALGAGGRQ